MALVLEDRAESLTIHHHGLQERMPSAFGPQMAFVSLSSSAAALSATNSWQAG
ncbi:MAG: hypothetical protein ACK5QW_05090 [Cyanobacteriota bacterium]|jgi:hypothetical protein